MERFPAAPWSKLLWAATIFSVGILGAVSYAAWRAIPRATAKVLAEEVGTAVAVVPLLVAAISVLYVVRSFELEGRDLRVQRLLWWTVVPLDDLQRISTDPYLLRGSLRLFGNGGLFSITGVFWNRRVGRYRAFITDPKRVVVLVTRSRTLALSPEDPVMLVDRLRALFPGVVVEPPARR